MKAPATLVEHESERMRQTRLLDQVIKTSRRIPLNNLLQIREYPKDMHQVLTLYAEGYSLASFLVGQKGENGRSIYLKFLQDAHEHGWETAISRHYGYKSVGQLEKQWHGWILAGSPSFKLPEGQLYANATDPSKNIAIRSQSPETGTARPVTKSAPASPAPLAMIPRKLRVAVNTGPYRRNQAQTQRITSQSEHPLNHVARGTAEDVHPRRGDQVFSGPSLHPKTLPLSGDGPFSESDDCFAFPGKRSIAP